MVVESNQRGPAEVGPTCDSLPETVVVTNWTDDFMRGPLGLSWVVLVTKQFYEVYDCPILAPQCF